MEFTFDARLWRWEGPSAWYFVALPEDVADEIEDAPLDRRGFGSVRVRVTVGATTWRTSLFPDKGRGTFVLPVKKQVREREGMVEGELVRIALTVEEQQEGRPAEGGPGRGP